MAFNSSNYIFIGTSDDGIFRSTNNGNGWLQVNNGLTTNYVRSIAIRNDQIIFVGTNQGVFRSRDNGENWDQINNGLNFSNIRCLTFNLDGFIFAGTFGGGIFRSTNDGELWEDTNSGINATHIHDIICDSIGQLIAATTDFGIFKSTNNGDIWFELNNGLLDYNVYSLALNSEKYLYAGTLTRGVYKSIYPTTTEVLEVKELLTNFYLSQNFPNPFNPTTKIKFTISNVETRHASSLQMVTLKVYDILGNEVATLVNEEKQPGIYEVDFDAANHSGNVRNLTSGIYFYQLLVSALQSKDGKADNFIETKKMVLIK
jgi:ligand-binding sensor domain-containing protein